MYSREEEINPFGFIRADSELDTSQASSLKSLVKKIELFDASPEIDNFKELFVSGTDIFNNIRGKSSGNNIQLELTDMRLNAFNPDNYIRYIDVDYFHKQDRGKRRDFSVRLVSQLGCSYRVRLIETRNSIRKKFSPAEYRILDSLIGREKEDSYK